MTLGENLKEEEKETRVSGKEGKRKPPVSCCYWHWPPTPSLPPVGFELKKL
jgi:hypothetical protein